MTSPTTPTTPTTQTTQTTQTTNPALERLQRVDPLPDGRKIVLQWEPEIASEEQVAWLASAVAEMVAAGRVLKHDQTVQVGWNLYKIHQLRDGNLTLLEGDMASVPFQTTHSVARSLRQLYLQRLVLEVTGLMSRAAFPTYGQTCIVCKALEPDSAFLMRRNEIEGADSGWFIGCVDDDHDHSNPDNLTLKQLYHAVVGFPCCVPFLPLPTDTMVCVGAESVGPLVIFDGEYQLLGEDSFQKLVPVLGYLDMLAD